MALNKYDLESDAVVIGYGGAGGVAAITAHDNGARVIILEKMPAGGGNTKMSGGAILTATGIEAIQYVAAISFGTLEKETIEALVRNAMKSDDYIRRFGGEPEAYSALPVGYPCPTIRASFPQVAGADFTSIRGIKGTKGTRGERLWELISRNVEQRQIQTLFNTPAKELITNERKEVIGVLAEREGKEIAIKAKRAVILTCGGFEHDDALKWDFLACKPCYAYGNTGNTGDGLRMAQEVGAALWHMDRASASAGFKTEEYKAAFNIRFISERFIYVDKEGNRFIDEAGIELHEIADRLSVFDTKRMDYPRIPMYAIFDDVARRKAPLYPGEIGANKNIYKWSLDNSAEIAKGWIIQGKSIKDVASQIQINEDTLEKTVSTYNEYCKARKDPAYNRPKETLVPIESPPYYAIKLWPSLYNTQGGPQRDKESRVLNSWGKPIPRLYAAGELGSIWGFLYTGGGNIGEALVFGQIAGRNASLEKPWDQDSNELLDSRRGL